MPQRTSPAPPAVRVLTRTGITVVPDLGPAARGIVARHWNAVRRYLEYGDDTALVDLERAAGNGGDVSVGNHVLLFELDRIEYHAMRGDVRFESIYDEVV